jgi:hypothetical protein
VPKKNAPARQQAGTRYIAPWTAYWDFCITDSEPSGQNCRRPELASVWLTLLTETQQPFTGYEAATAYWHSAQKDCVPLFCFAPLRSHLPAPQNKALLRTPSAPRLGLAPAGISGLLLRLLGGRIAGWPRLRGRLA